LANEVELKSEIQFLDIDSIKPNDYNPNYMPESLFNDLTDDIKRNGFYGAIIINKEKIIVDGEHRWRALKKLGVKACPVILDDSLTKDTSKIMTLRLNRERGFLVPVETGNLLTNLTKTVPIDILSEATAIPMPELTILTNLSYEPGLQDLSKSGEVINWSRIDTLINTLCTRIKDELDGKPLTVCTILRGGLIPARLVADRMNIPNIQILNGNETETPALIVDDIYDTGKTHKKYGKGVQVYATLFKRKDMKSPKNLIYGTETLGAEYVVFPWDRFEYKRNQK